jgi:hypothetical protein
MEKHEIPVTHKQRVILEKQAKEKGVSVDDYCEQLLVDFLKHLKD